MALFEANSDLSYRTEHILVGLSSAPSNTKIVETAAKMANAFNASFTALFIRTPKSETMTAEDKTRLQNNISLAEKLGATVTTVFGEDVPFQLAEYARLSGVTKIVVGRSAATRKLFFRKPTLADRLISMAPNVDIHIIPDGTVKLERQSKTTFNKQDFLFIAKDLLSAIIILILASAIGLLFAYLGFSEANIITVFILGVLATSIITNSKISWGFASIAGVLVFNFFFTEPKYTLLAYDDGYPITFIIMFIAAVITGSIASRMKNQAKQWAKIAYRTKILFDANQLIQKATSDDEISDVTAKQLNKLLNRFIVVCKEDNNNNIMSFFYGLEESGKEAFANATPVAEWTLENKKKSGKGTDVYPDSDWTFFPVSSSNRTFGVIGIHTQAHTLDSFENSITLSIIGECALALENNRNAKEKELAAVLAKNEQLRANLLRAISHDLRTPLTAISGNANNLVSNGFSFDDATKQQIYADIYDDSIWLINLVENLLSITRLEENVMNLNFTTELIDEVITEALRHINRNKINHVITVSASEMLFAKMDARLIVQVIINIVDNAIKYTPSGSRILIKTEKKDDKLQISIADNGNGIADDMKPRVFDMFYIGSNKIVDSRRSLGLGLALCKSIINAHGGEIAVSDNCPSGVVFTFTLPISEVNIIE